MTHCSTEMAAGFRLTLPLRFASRLQKRPRQEVSPPVPAWRICRVVIDIIPPRLWWEETCLPQERKMGRDTKGRDGEAFPADLIFCLFPSPLHRQLVQERWQRRGAGPCCGELCPPSAAANPAVPSKGPCTSICWEGALKWESPFPATACQCQCEVRPTSSGQLMGESGRSHLSLCSKGEIHLRYHGCCSQVPPEGCCEATQA